MNMRPRFSEDSSTPLYIQFADYVKDCVRNGVFPPDKPLPSINAMKIQMGISRETIVKGYAYLCKENVLVPHQGMGYFVKPGFLTGRRSVIIFLDKMSQHLQNILDGFIERVNEKVDITIRMHYQNPQWLAEEIDKSQNRYDYYLLFPHFAQDDVTQATVNVLVDKLPAEKLIVLDRLLNTAPAKSGASYQSIEEDIPEALAWVMDDVVPDDKAKYSYEAIHSELEPLPLASASHSAYRVALSRSHQTPETHAHVEELRAEHPDLEIVEQGSSYKFCLLAEGSVDYYIRTTTTSEWDTAAGELILSESGGVTLSYPDGAPLYYNKESLDNPWFVARRV